MKTPVFLFSAAMFCVSGELNAQQAAVPATGNAKATATATAPAPAKPAAAATPAPAKPAATPVAAVEPKKPENKPYSIDLAFGVQSVQFDDSKTQDPYLYGAVLSMSGYLSKTRPVLKNLLLTGDVGLFYGEYTDTVFNEHGAYSDVPGLQDEQVIKRKNTQYNVPVHLTLAYEFALKDFRFRVGPSVGFTFVSIDSDFHGYNRITNPDNPSDPNSNGIQNEKFLKKSSSQAVFSYGGTAAATWNITNRVRLDLQYRLIANGALNFGYERDFGSSLSHQVSLGLGWRF